jgi:hypothetical protein
MFTGRKNISDKFYEILNFLTKFWSVSDKESDMNEC